MGAHDCTRYYLEGRIKTIREKIKKELKEILSEKRYRHSVNTAEKCEELAKIYNVNIEEAYITGLLHDIAREMSKEEVAQYIENNTIDVDEFEEKDKEKLLHSKIGADIARKKYGLNENAINAIKYHTYGHPNMDILAKIVYIGDEIEKDREYKEVEEIRFLSKENIDKAVLKSLEYRVQRRLNEGREVHPSMITTINCLRK